MKLTNYMRDAFVKAVMDDVPSVDYFEMIRERAIANAVRLLPAPIQQVWKNAELRGFVKTDHVGVAGCYLRVPGVDVDETKIEDEDIRQWSTLHHEQSRAREELMRKVRAVAYSCTTTKTLLQKLPEFEKYLPTEDPKVANLPAMANLVTDLVKAGWPKGGKKQEEPVAA